MRVQSEMTGKPRRAIPLLTRLFPSSSSFIAQAFAKYLAAIKRLSILNNNNNNNNAGVPRNNISNETTGSSGSTSSTGSNSSSSTTSGSNGSGGGSNRHSSMMMMMMQSNNDQPVSNKQKRLAILYLVLIPYIKSKLDEWYKRESDPINMLGLNEDDVDEDDGSIRKPLKKSIRRLFVKVYPYINAFYEATFFLYQILYLYEYTSYYTPFLHIQRIVLKRLTRQDIETHNTTIANRRNERLAVVRNWPLPGLFIPIVSVLDSVLDYSKFILPASVFLFKSLEWWYSENRISSPSVPVPPPPAPPKPAVGGLAVPQDKQQCPLCLQPRTNPAICGSGFVFCYPCIFNYVQQHSKCPITYIPTTTDQLRKIYETM
ncbi:RING zinc finger-containing protein [Cavenderia fasciculata]|uniref:Peroxin-12 n=1 Tax=Cavenderia fasciculata TaxID=261658 RepID=F4PIR8_CACFS|nr:RING zinc finger-containing protein [Cavenderia fasciculata]EGG24647.1 RING zinc finger-containing protein [Cavenderia fasciculata]|eukprot:XP_004362498.1 RING zinc finger-containing protein [Cavenderia fasciculata]